MKNVHNFCTIKRSPIVCLLVSSAWKMNSLGMCKKFTAPNVSIISLTRVFFLCMDTFCIQKIHYYINKFNLYIENVLLNSAICWHQVWLRQSIRVFLPCLVFGSFLLVCRLFQSTHPDVHIFPRQSPRSLWTATLTVVNSHRGSHYECACDYLLQGNIFYFSLLMSLLKFCSLLMLNQRYSVSKPRQASTQILSREFCSFCSQNCF